MSVEGIDTADTDGNDHANWAMVKAGGKGFVLWRANYGIAPDAHFDAAWPRLQAAGLIRGAYLFWRALQDPVQQADVFCSHLAGYGYGPGDFPPEVDLEFPGPDGRKGTGLSAEEALDRFVACARRVRDRFGGVLPAIYDSARIWIEDLPGLRLPDDLRGCAQWPAYYRAGDPPPIPGEAPGNFWLEQYAGDAHGVPGLSGICDLDRFHLYRAWVPADPRRPWVLALLGLAAATTADDERDALLAYQTKHGLTPDAVVGPATFAWLAWERPGV